MATLDADDLTAIDNLIAARLGTVVSDVTTIKNKVALFFPQTSIINISGDIGANEIVGFAPFYISGGDPTLMLITKAPAQAYQYDKDGAFLGIDADIGAIPFMPSGAGVSHIPSESVSYLFIHGAAAGVGAALVVKNNPGSPLTIASVSGAWTPSRHSNPLVCEALDRAFVVNNTGLDAFDLLEFQLSTAALVSTTALAVTGNTLQRKCATDGVSIFFHAKNVGGITGKTYKINIATKAVTASCPLSVSDDCKGLYHNDGLLYLTGDSRKGEVVIIDAASMTIAHRTKSFLPANTMAGAARVGSFYAVHVENDYSVPAGDPGAHSLMVFDKSGAYISSFALPTEVLAGHMHTSHEFSILATMGEHEDSSNHPFGLYMISGMSQTSGTGVLVKIQLPVTSEAGFRSAAIQAKTDNLRVRKNTALAGFTFPMRDLFGSPKTGLTVTAQRSLDGATYAACANAVVEIASGAYKIDLAASDLNGDVIMLKFTATGARQREITIVTES